MRKAREFLALVRQGGFYHRHLELVGSSLGNRLQMLWSGVCSSGLGGAERVLSESSHTAVLHLKFSIPLFPAQAAFADLSHRHEKRTDSQCSALCQMKPVLLPAMSFLTLQELKPLGWCMHCFLVLCLVESPVLFEIQQVSFQSFFRSWQYQQHWQRKNEILFCGGTGIFALFSVV